MHEAQGRKRTFWLICIAWGCAACLAALEAHFFLKGYRLNGDDVVFEYQIIHGDILGYIVRTAKDQARIGFYVLLPLLLIGSHFSVHLWFRIIYVALWYVDLLLFAIWLARVLCMRVALPLFIAVVALQSMIGVYMPPMGYPLELGVPLFVILATRLHLAKSSYLATGWGEPTPGVSRVVISIVYVLAIISSEYMMITGLFMVIAEVAAPRPINRLWKNRKVLARYRIDALCLVLVFSAYLIFRVHQSTHYEGTNLDGLKNYNDLLYVFAMHLWYGSWLPFLKLNSLPLLISFKPLLASTLCGFALLIYWQQREPDHGSATVNRTALATTLVAWLIAITLPVVAATSRQAPCLADGTCAYLDSRISLLLLVALLALTGLSIARSEKARMFLQILTFMLLTIGSGISYVIAKQQAVGSTVASGAWERARDIACIREAIVPADLAGHIDPGNQISILFNIDRHEYWASYVNYLAIHESCPSAQVSVAIPVRRNGKGSKYLVTGWSQPESNGAWTDGKTAVLGIPLSPSSQPLVLKLVLQGFRTGIDSWQTVSVETNGRITQRLQVLTDAPKTYDLPIPIALAANGGTLTVRLLISNPASPAQLRQSSDPRLLGVFLSELEITGKPQNRE